MKIDSEQDLLDFAEHFAKTLNLETEKVVIELIGDVGVGKTTFVRGLARGLKIAEPITSPSFTISKTYAFNNNKILTHYDFYRLNDPGLMLEDLNDSIKNSALTVVEWGNSVQNLLPENRIKIELKYNDDNSREVTIL